MYGMKKISAAVGPCIPLNSLLLLFFIKTASGPAEEKILKK